jgi:hypothetical protein
VVKSKPQSRFWDWGSTLRKYLRKLGRSLDREQLWPMLLRESEEWEWARGGHNTLV